MTYKGFHFVLQGNSDLDIPALEHFLGDYEAVELGMDKNVVVAHDPKGNFPVKSGAFFEHNPSSSDSSSLRVYNMKDEGVTVVYSRNENFLQLGILGDTEDSVEKRIKDALGYKPKKWELTDDMNFGPQGDYFVELVGALKLDD